MENTLDTHVKAYEGGSPYDFDNEILLTWYPKRVISLAKNATSILELGLGHGFTTHFFAKHFDRHVVLDGSPAVIENFKKSFPDCSADIVEVFFENYVSRERFDVIVLGFVLEHVDDPYEIILRYKNFLAPNGKMFIAVPNAEALNRRLGFLAGLLPDMKNLSDHDILLGHKRYYTVNSLTKEVNDAGFDVEVMEGIYLKPFTTKQILSLNLDSKIIDSMCRIGINYPELSCGILAQIKESV